MKKWLPAPSRPSCCLLSDRLFLRLMISLLLGVLIGALSCRRAGEELLTKLDVLFLTNIQTRLQGGMLMTFVSSFASACLFLGALFLMGISLWGAPGACCLPFVRGYGYGLAVGSIVMRYGLWGVGYHLLIVLPGAFLGSAVMSVGAARSARHSLSLFRSCFHPLTAQDPALRLSRYGMSMLLLLLLSAAGAGLDTLLFELFSGCFPFPSEG